MSVLQVRNRQRGRAVNARVLRQLIARLLRDLRSDGRFELGVHLVGVPEMVRLNERYLHHTGCTDVITFDHEAGLGSGRLRGELFICVDVAVTQARRYRTSWTAEVARYVIHGLLHLHGYDDSRPTSRRRMKRAEDGWLRRLRREGCVERLAGKYPG